MTWLIVVFQKGCCADATWNCASFCCSLHLTLQNCTEQTHFLCKEQSRHFGTVNCGIVPQWCCVWEVFKRTAGLGFKPQWLVAEQAVQKQTVCTSTMHSQPPQSLKSQPMCFVTVKEQRMLWPQWSLTVDARVVWPTECDALQLLSLPMTIMLRQISAIRVEVYLLKFFTIYQSQWTIVTRGTVKN